MPIAAANLVVIGVPLHVASYEEIEMAVVVVVEEARRHGPASARDASLGGYGREGAIAIVVIEDVLSVAGYVEIGISVVVVIAEGEAKTVIIVALVGEP